MQLKLRSKRKKKIFFLPISNYPTNYLTPLTFQSLQLFIQMDDRADWVSVETRRSGSRRKFRIFQKQLAKNKYVYPSGVEPLLSVAGKGKVVLRYPSPDSLKSGHFSSL